jgi:ferric-dicitrate binding protein FerR (iron transport regulator)
MNQNKAFDPILAFTRSMSGDLSGPEREELQHWLSTPENRQQWQQLQKIWGLSSEMPIPIGNPLESQWWRLRARLSAPGARRAPLSRLILEARKSWQFPRIRWAMVAAFLIGALLLAKYSPLINEPEIQTVTVPFGERFKVVLADGSNATLNSGSILKYPDRFTASERRVELTGEGYFQISASEIPFKVETRSATTRVLGTEFNIRDWERETDVFVKSGKVAVLFKQAAEPKEIQLSPGQLATHRNGSLSVRVVENADEVLAWQRGQLVFRREPLSEVLAEIERHLALRIEADSTLLNQTITASFSNEPAAQLVKALATALNAHVEIHDNSYRLTQKN